MILMRRSINRLEAEMTDVLEQKTTKLVNLTMDNLEITAPEGTLIVDAAKMAGIDIPVF